MTDSADRLRPPGSTTFGPVVLLGLASAVLAAVASARPWVGTGPTRGASDASMTALDAGTRYPLASAVSLVLLAAWGVLLVTRGRVRRAFALLAALAAVGLVVCVISGYLTLPDTARSSYDELMGRGASTSGFTGWFWTSAVCSVVALVPAGLAVRLAGQWPEMGARYDAPGASAFPEPSATEPGTATPGVPDPGTSDRDRDLWHALDEGHDPTDTTHP